MELDIVYRLATLYMTDQSRSKYLDLLFIALLIRVKTEVFTLIRPYPHDIQHFYKKNH